jgi:hypothetical protein
MNLRTRAAQKKEVDDVEEKNENEMEWMLCNIFNILFFFICYIKNKDSFIHEFLYSEKRIENVGGGL